MGFIQHSIPPLYCCRTFGEKFSNTFDFITANWRVLLRMLTIVLLPLCAVQAINVNGLVSSVYSDLDVGGDIAGKVVGVVLNYCALLVFGIISTAVLVSVVYAIMKLYHEQNADGTAAHPELGSMTFAQLRPLMMRQLRAAFKAIGAIFLVSVVLMAVIMAVVVPLALASMSGALVIAVLVAYVVALVVLVPMTLALPVYSFEDIGFFSGIRKTLVYGFKTWRGIVALMCVMWLLVSVVLGVLGMPWIIAFMLKTMFLSGDIAELGFTLSVWFSFLQYLCGVVYVYTSYMGYAVVLVALAYQYGHAREKIDGEEFGSDINF